MMKMLQVWQVAIAFSLSGLVTVFAAEASIESIGFTALANYGFGGLMTAALGYALWGVYRAHSEERKTWLDKWEKHFNQLLESMRETDKARHELAEEVRAHMRDHAELNEEVKKTLIRMAIALDSNPLCNRRINDDKPR